MWCDPFCSGEWLDESLARGLDPLPPGFGPLRLVMCAHCAHCGDRCVKVDGCPLCPCPPRSVWTTLAGEMTATALRLSWRKLVGPTPDCDALVMARLSSPIPERAWGVAGDLLVAGGLSEREVAAAALRAAGWQVE